MLCLFCPPSPPPRARYITDKSSVSIIPGTVEEEEGLTSRVTLKRAQMRQSPTSPNELPATVGRLARRDGCRGNLSSPFITWASLSFPTLPSTTTPTLPLYRVHLLLQGYSATAVDARKSKFHVDYLPGVGSPGTEGRLLPPVLQATEESVVWCRLWTGPGWFKLSPAE